MSPIAPRPARVDLLLRATDGTAPCVAFGDLRWTYAELDSAVDAAASRLAAAGLRPGDRIAVLSTPRPEYLLLWLAASRIGAVYAGLNPRYTARELSGILDFMEQLNEVDVTGVEPMVSVTPPCTLNGQIASGEVNRYRFTARKGQRLVISNGRATIEGTPAPQPKGRRARRKQAKADAKAAKKAARRGRRRGAPAEPAA